MEIYQPRVSVPVQREPWRRVPRSPALPRQSIMERAFQVQTPDAANISSVVMMRNRLGDALVRYGPANGRPFFHRGLGNALGDGPPNGNIAPPGYYMLFLLNTQGVPSVASMVQVPSNCRRRHHPELRTCRESPRLNPRELRWQFRFPSAQTAGNLNVVAVMWGDTTSTVSSVTDSKGNTYALAVGPTKATGLTSAIYYAKNIAGGSNTVTVTFNQTAGYPNVNVLEYSGLDTANPLDVTAAATGTGTTANSGSATTTSANELIVGAGNPSQRIYGGGERIQQPDHQRIRGHIGRQDRQQHGKLQRDGDADLRDLGDADGHVPWQRTRCDRIRRRR